MRQGLWRRIWEHRHFYAFISPFFLIFAVFGLYPLLFSLYLSFVQWDGLTEIKWVGLANFQNMLHDELFFTSLWNTLVIGLLYIPPMFVGAFLFALALNAGWIKLRGMFRAAFFMPVITPMVVVAIVFSLIYSQEGGLLNYVLGGVGEVFPSLKIKPIAWLTSDTWFKPALAILLVWRWTGYNMVLMLAGLQGISTEYYEAARIDGAGLFQRMWHITLPLMRPVFVFCAIMSLIGTVYMFDEVFVLTQGGLGGPGVSGINFGLYLFNTSFADFKFGYASSMAYTMAFLVFLASLLILRLRKTEN